MNGETEIDSLQSTFTIAYCNFFGCSADYLLGFISQPIHEETDIEKTIGLNDASVATLKRVVAFRTYFPEDAETSHIFENERREIKILNYVIGDTERFLRFLSNLSVYIDNPYTIPLHYDTEKGYIPSGFQVIGEKGYGIEFGYEVKDNAR